jgi:hypothetical protein
MEQDAIEKSNLQLFREILANPIIERCTTSAKSKSKVRKARSGRKSAIKPVAQEVTAEAAEEKDAEELGDFIEVDCLLFLNIILWFVSFENECS